MAFAALAILGHRSAHSFPIGPVIADPNTYNRNQVTKKNWSQRIDCERSLNNLKYDPPTFPTEKHTISTHPCNRIIDQLIKVV
jgi:hypothetical protein